MSFEEINHWNSHNEEEDEEDKNLYFTKKDEKASSAPIDLVGYLLNIFYYFIN